MAAAGQGRALEKLLRMAATDVRADGRTLSIDPSLDRGWQRAEGANPRDPRRRRANEV